MLSRLSTKSATLSQQGARSFAVVQKAGVNQNYRPETRPLPQIQLHDNSTNGIDLTAHKKAEWTSEEIRAARDDHVMFSWMPGKMAKDITLCAKRGDGPYITDHDGKKILDWSSGAVCANMGHTVEQNVIDAIVSQLEKTPFVYGDLYTTEVRCRLASLLSQIFPDPLNSFIFYNSGAEANEAAIRLARHYTGRNKVLSRHRSYHGGTLACLHMTGDARTHLVSKPAATGFLKIFDPTPWSFEWANSGEEDECVEKSLQLLHEQIIHEDPNSIACIILESITGTNGWLIPPTKWMQGVRALCDKYGIMLINDEVMAGFGRTGKWFGFQNFDGYMPDIVTFAKGVSSSIQPVSGLAMSDTLKAHFMEKPCPYGSTFCAHPVGMAAAYANVQNLVEQDIIARAKAMEPVMAEEMSKLVDKYHCVRAGRVIGAAGGLDIQDENEQFMDAKTMMHMRNSFRDTQPVGLTTLARDHFIHCTPALNVDHDVIREGFDIMGKTFAKFEAKAL